MPRRQTSTQPSSEVARLKGQLAAMRAHMRVEPVKARIRPDPPAIVSNPVRVQAIELKVSGPTAATTGQQIVDEIRRVNGLATSTNMRLKVLRVALYGPVGVAKGRITLTDALTGFSVSDQGTLGGRAACGLDYPNIALPTVDTSTASVSGVLVNALVEEASEDNYGLVRLSCRWRTY